MNFINQLGMLQQFRDGFQLLVIGKISDLGEIIQRFL
jgi:hypothetical protein